MRNSLLLLVSSIFLSLTTLAQTTPPIIVAPGEYQAFMWHTSDKILYAVGGAVGTQGIGEHPTGTLGTPMPVQFPAGTQIKSVSSPLHNGIGVDVNGNVWFWGANDFGMRGDGTLDGATSFVPVQIKTDSLGNPFNNVAQVSCWWNETLSSGALVCKNDGTVWVWGVTTGGMRGNGYYGGANYKPVQVNIPGNPHIVKVLAGEICMALDNAGNVYTWGGNGRIDLLGTNATDFTTVHKVTLPKPAKDIAGADMIAYALATDGTLYGWGIYGAYLGIGDGPYLASNTFQPLPVDLTSQLNLPHPIAQVLCNSVCTHVILTDSTLWGWGDNTEGCIGNGVMIDWATYHTPYLWDWGASELLQHKPVQIAPLVHNFVAMFAGSSACFYYYAEDATGQLYSWGRNKSEVLSGGVVSATPDIDATYSDASNQPTITAVNPFTLKKIYPSTCPICLVNPNATACPGTVVANTPPVSVAGVNQTINLPTSTGVLDGSGSHDADGIVYYYKWRQVSGPSSGTVLDSAYAKTRISGLVGGTYVYSLTVTDNGWATNTSTVTVTVKSTGNVAPTVTAGAAKTITLPASSTTLTGTATGNNGATIKGLSWKQTSGPANATIATPATISTTVSGLTVAGSYIFSLTGTDNNNLTGTGSVTITVNAAAAVAPTVAAGAARTITLPVSTTTLTGTATGNSGATIKGLSWKQTSGPATATIATATSISTTVSGLIVAGSYVFSLTATDNNNLTGTGSVTITVAPAVTSTPPPTPVPPTVAAGKGQAITLPTSSTTLAGTAAGNSGATIKSLSWKQSGGPATAVISSPASLNTAISGLAVAGNYVFTLTATDNNGKAANGSMTVTVNPNPNPPGKTSPVTGEVPPTVSAGKGQAITLPASSVTLTGTATGNSGATIKGLTWKESSGPATAVIGSPASLSTAVSGLTAAGNYVFTLTATDNNGETANGSMTVVVSPGVKTPPAVNAGGDPIITLPTSSITLTGSASGTNGATITGVFWELISGPGFVKFSNEYALTTTISSLVAGTYVFELAATDNNGLTSYSTVDVIVKPAPGTTETQNGEANSATSIPGDSLNSRPLLLFPNPAHDLMNVRVNTTVAGKVLMVIYDAKGNRVQTIQVEKDQWAFQTSIDVSRLAQGVYTLQVVTGNTVNASRFIKL